MDRFWAACIIDYKLSLVTNTDLITQKTMTLLSYATTEVDKVEETKSTLPLKPLVLPMNTMPLKVAWKDNRERLEKAGVFEYLCWIQSIMRLAYVENFLNSSKFIQCLLRVLKLMEGQLTMGWIR